MAKKSGNTKMDWQSYIDASDEELEDVGRGEKISLGREATAWCMKLIDHFLLGRPRGVAGAFLARHLDARSIDRLQGVVGSAAEKVQEMAAAEAAKKRRAEARALVKQLQEAGLDTSDVEKQIEKM